MEPINSLPEHVAIIMDGNRRWAKIRGKSANAGHKAGYKRFLEVLELARKKGIKEFTVYALSTENWKRSQEEVSGMMDLTRLVIKEQFSRLEKENVKIRILGRLEDFPEDIQKSLKTGIDKTKNNTGQVLNIAFSYGGRPEIVDAVKKIIAKGYAEEDVTEETVAENLYSPEMRDPELIIRTGGEKRLSNFLLWESAYSELYFTETLWPDFDEKEFDKVLAYFENIKRNFGK